MSPSAEPLAPLGGATGTLPHKTAPAKKVAAPNTTESKPNGPSNNIIDIRQASVEMNLRDEIVSQFCPKKGPRTLPTLLLYDEAGLQLFEDVRCPCLIFASPVSGPCISLALFLFSPSCLGYFFLVTGRDMQPLLGCRRLSLPQEMTDTKAALPMSMHCLHCCHFRCCATAELPLSHHTLLFELFGMPLCLACPANKPRRSPNSFLCLSAMRLLALLLFIL